MEVGECAVTTVAGVHIMISIIRVLYRIPKLPTSKSERCVVRFQNCRYIKAKWARFGITSNKGAIKKLNKSKASCQRES